MTSDLFFYSHIKDVKDKLIYEEKFVLFYLNLQLQRTSEYNKEEIKLVLEKLYGKRNIKDSKIIKFCNQHLKSKGKNYILNIPKEEEDLYQKTQEYLNDLNSLLKMQKNEIKNKIQKEIKNAEMPFEEQLKYYIMYFYKTEEEPTEKEKMLILYRYFIILKNYNKIYRTIYYKLKNISEIFNILEISELDLTEEQLELLNYNNIFTIKNLKNTSIDLNICIFGNCIEKFVNEISKYAIDKNAIINKLKQELNEIIKPEWRIVLSKRINLQTMKRRTLADIGKELNLTRQRIKQIENRATIMLLKQAEKVDKITYCFYKNINKENKNFITIEELLEYIKDEQLVEYLIIILSSEKTRITVNEEYGIIYSDREISLDEIQKESEEELEEIIPIADIEKYNKVQKYIIKNEYKIYKEKILVRKGTKASTIYINEIKENFIKGYNIGSQEDYNKLINIITKKYGNIEIPSIRAIQGLIERGDFVQIDRGKYKAREYTTTLPEELIEEIISFIIKNSPLVPYNLIYEEFRKRLEKLGVDNKFYLKGIIDEKLPKEFDTSRDLINTNTKENTTLYNIMHEIFTSFKEEFTIEEVSEKMPGLKEYSYENYARAEEKNGLINIATRTYIYIDKLNITKETQEELKEYIDNLFEKMDTKILTAKKIYANLSIMNKELLNKLHITARFGDYELFSIIQYLYKDKYYFSRPIISIEENFTSSAYLLIKEYVKRLDKFNYTDVKNYIYKMNLRGLASYMNFMEDLSDEYVQINQDTMIRKEKIEISKEKLEKIEEILNLLVKDKEFTTESFDGYFIFPRLNRPWNKYLLIGIIRSFFKNKYEVENTTKFYDTTDFIIRRIN